MKKNVSFLALALAASAVFAADDAEEKVEEKSEATEEFATKPAAAPAAFTALPFCRKATIPAEVKKPGAEEWVSVEEGRFYPLGSAYRTRKGGFLVLAFGAESSVTISNESAFATRPQPLGDRHRALVGIEGTIELDLASNLPEGSFLAAFPGFTLKNPAGSSRLTVKQMGDGDCVTVRCITGSLAIDGRHFAIPSMRAADEVAIRTSHDALETFLYGTSGDYIVKVDQGIKTKRTVDDEGAVKEVAEKSALDWHLSPKTKVRISRAVPAIGERMSVAVMAFDAAGEMKNNFAFAENRAEVNSGELVKASKEDAAALAKRAAEATETTAAEDADDAKAEKKSDKDEDADEADDDSEKKNKNNEDSDKE